MKSEKHALIVAIAAGSFFGLGFFGGIQYGGFKEAQAIEKKIKTDLYVQDQMDYIFSGIDKCHAYTEDKKKKEAEDATKKQE